MDFTRRDIIRWGVLSGFVPAAIHGRDTGQEGVRISATQDQDEWQMYQHDAQNTGKADSGPLRGAEVAWSTTLSGTDFGQPLSSPVVSNERLFVSHLTGETERLVALDIETGTERWSYSVAENAGLKPATPAVQNGVVYAGSRGTVVAIDAANGSEQWRLEETTVGAFNGLVIRDGTLYTTDQQQIYAIDTSTGEVEWTFQPPEDASGDVTMSREILGTNLAVTDETVYYNTLVFRTDTEAGTRERSEGVAALDIASREEQWVFESFEGEYDALDATEINVDQSSPAVSEGTVYCGLPKGEICALDAATGTPEWRVETESVTRFSPAVDENSVYIYHGGTVCAYDRATGAELWCADTGPVSPVVTGQAVYTQNSAHDTNTGERLWALDQRERRGSPALVDGRLYCELGQTGEEGMYALVESQEDDSTSDDPDSDGGSGRSTDDTGGGFSVGSGSGVLWPLLVAILAVGSYVYYRLRRSGDE